MSRQGGSVTDGAPYNTFDGNRQVCNVWWNDTDRNCNLNWYDNEWNANYWFAFVRESLRSPPAPVAGGVSFCTLRSQPPSILPMSCRGSDSATYFLLSKSFTSHATCRKNFSKSIFPAAFCTYGNFCSRFK